jgi:multidrug efflux pump
LANDQLLKAEDYRPLILGYTNGNAIQLGDVADVEDSVENLRAGRLCRRQTERADHHLQAAAGANIIGTVDRVRQELPSLKASIPAGIDFKVMLDRTTTIRASVRDVERTLLISIALVILVVFVFLRNWGRPP